MSRLFDLIKQGKWSERHAIRGEEIPGLPGAHVDLTSREVDSILADHPERLVADNVAEYYFERFYDPADGKVGWHRNLFEDLWNFAPPWKDFWIEYEMPPNSGMSAEIKRVGLLFTANEIEPRLRPTALRRWLERSYYDSDGHAYSKGNRRIETLDDWMTREKPRFELTPRWLVVSYTFIEWRSEPGLVQGPMIEANFMVSETGELCSYPLVLTSTGLQQRYGLSQERLLTMAHTWAICSRPCMMAVTFTHGSNVQLTEVAPKPIDAKLRKSLERKGRPIPPPPVSYKTIDIKPVQRAVREVAEREGVSEHEAIKRLKMRGHWKNYQQRGLFGKHRGVYFWHGMDATEADKRPDVDYKVNAPKEKAS